MYKRQIERDLKSFCGSGMITKTQIARYLGLSRCDQVPRSYLEGLNRLGKRYFIIEVAERLSAAQEKR